jgi:hypothetical protein
MRVLIWERPVVILNPSRLLRINIGSIRRFSATLSRSKALVHRVDASDHQINEFIFKSFASSSASITSIAHPS